MIFSGSLFDAVLEGRKTVTRRMVSENPNSPWSIADDLGPEPEPRGFRVGRDYAIEPSRTEAGHPAKRIKIVSTSLEPLASVGREGEAEAEGFINGPGPCDCAGGLHEADCEARLDVSALERFIATWTRLHGDFDAAVFVWRVEFVVVDRG